MNRKGALRSAIYVAIFLASIVAVTSVATAVTITRLEEQFLRLRAELLGDLEVALDQEISWEAVSPSILRGLTVHGVRVSGGTGVARSVSIEFRLAELLLGDPYRMIPRVTIRRPAVIIDTPEALERLLHTIEFVRGIGEGRRVINVTVEEGTLTYAEEDTRIVLRDVRSEVAVDTVQVSGRVRAALELESTLQDEPFTLSSMVQADLDGVRTGDPLGVTVELLQLRSSHFTAADQAFRVERRRETVHVERIRSQDALDIAARADLAAETVEVNVRSQEFTPASLVSFRGPWSPVNQWISQPVTTDSRIVLDLEGSLIEAAGSVSSRVAHSAVPEPFSLRGDYRLTPGSLALPSLTVLSAQGEAHFSGNWRLGTIAPSGTLDLSDFAYGGSPVLDGRLILSGSDSAAGISAERLITNGVPLYNVVTSIRTGTPAGSEYNTVEAALSLEESRRSRVRGTVRFANLQDLTGALELNDLPAERLSAVAAAHGYTVELPAPAAEVRFTGSVRVDYRDDDLIVRIPYLTGRDDRLEDRFVSISGEYRNGNITLNHFYLREQNLVVRGTGEAIVYRDNSITFSTEFSVNHMPYYLDGTLSPDGRVAITGPYGFTAGITRTPGRGFAITAETRNAPIPLGQARVSASLEGVFYDRAGWYLNVTELTARGIPLPGSADRPRTARVTLAAALGPETAQLAITDFTDDTSTLAGTVDLRYAFIDGEPEVSLSGRLGGTDTPEIYRFAGRYSRGTVAGDLRFSDAPATRFVSEVERGTVQGAIQVSGPREEPEARVFLESDQLIVNNVATSFRFLAQSDSSVLRLTQGEFVYGTMRLDVPQVIVDRQGGAIDGTVRFRRLEQTVELSITGTTDPIVRLEPELLRTSAVDLSIQATPGAEAPVPEDPRAWHYRLVRTEERTTLDRMDGAIRASLSDSGEFEVVLGGDLPYRGTAAGIVSADHMEVTVSNINVNLPDVPLLPAMQQVSIESGVVSGSLRLIGPPGNPDLFGTLNVRGLALRTPVSPDTLGPLDTALIFEEQLVRLQPTRTTIGRAPVEISARVLVTRLALEQFELILDMPGETGVHVVSEFGPINIDGFTRGNLLVAGTRENVEVSGTLTVYGAELAVATDFEPDMTDGPGALVDLQIRTGRAVRFIWPDTELPIIRSNFATGQEVAINIDTRADTFSLNGTVAIQSGDVFYFDRNFLLRDGRIEFRETQDDFDPRVTARAELRETSPDGPVRIFLIADGQRLSEFSPRFESSPPMEGAEIVAVLGGSILQVAGEGYANLPAALLSTSDFVTQIGFFRQFENAVRDQLDLDLFAIRTSVVQNILLTAITPVDEDVQRQVTPSLGTYLNNTSIFMGRYIGDSVFGQLVLQMRASDPEFFPEDDGIQRLGGVLIDSEISLEWQTPFFLLEWNFAPQNPEELFIRDNTFSFLWSFSY